MNKLLLALAAPLAIGATPALASDYAQGLQAGDAIATCTYMQNNRFNDPNYGPFMLRGTWKNLTSHQRASLLSIWQREGAYQCVNAVR